MRNRAFSLLCAAAVAAAAISAADVSGPVSGFVFDGSARAIRPVVGIPGAALLGEPIDAGFSMDSAAVAPEQDYAVAVSSDGSVRLVRLLTRTSQPLETLHGAPRRVAFSPRGSSAALLNSSTIDVYSGFPEKPALARTLELTGIGTPSSIAVSDDGGAVIAAAGDAVHAAGESAEWKAIEQGRWVFAFAPDSRDAVLAGPGGALKLLGDVARGGARQELAAAGGEAPAPSAVAFAGGGRIVLAHDRKIELLDASGRALGTHACECSPAGLARMGSVFRLGEMSDAPLWLFDGAPDEGRLVFVPAARRTKTEIE